MNDAKVTAQLETAKSNLALPGDSRSWMLPLMFEGQLIMFLVDTGSHVSIIHMNTYVSRFSDHPLLGWHGQIRHAAGQNLEIAGCMEGYIHYN